MQKPADQAKKRYLNSPKENLLVMDIKNKIIDICALLSKFQNNMRLTRFLILFAKMDTEKKQNVRLKQYYDKYIRSQNAANPKEYAAELQKLTSVSEEICADINAWIKEYYAEKALDLQSVSTKELK